MKLKFIIALSCLTLFGSAFSQAQPVYTPQNVNRAISGAINFSLVRRGYAVNDPRFLNTISRLTPRLTTLVAAGTLASVTTAAVTAPAWASAAIGLGVGVAAYLAIQGIYNWYNRPDGLIDISTSTIGNGMVTNGPYWGGLIKKNGVNIYVKGDSGASLATSAHVSFTGTPLTVPCTFTTYQYYCGSGGASFYSANAPANCPPGNYFYGNSCFAFDITPPLTTTTKSQTLQQAIIQLPSTELAKQLNPEFITAVSNKLWASAAAQTAYDGVPYSASDPVTTADTQAWVAANPTIAPTVGDFVAANPVTASQPTPWAIPSTSGSTGAVTAVDPNAGTTNSSTQPQINLGNDPVTPAPTLEETPTAQMILSPILGLVPSLKSFGASTPTGSCPQPSLHLFGQTQTFTAHCIIFENNKSVIQGAMTFVWALMAVLIILSA